MNLDLNYFRKKLEEEREKLERQLSLIAKRNPENPKDWKPTQPKLNPQASDLTEMADVFEKFETQVITGVALEAQLNEVQDAIGRIENGTCGLCGRDQKPINLERLEANPAAKTCIEHSK